MADIIYLHQDDCILGSIDEMNDCIDQLEIMPPEEIVAAIDKYTEIYSVMVRAKNILSLKLAQVHVLLHKQEMAKYEADREIL